MVVVSGAPLSQESAEFAKTLVFNPPLIHSPDDWQAVFWVVIKPKKVLESMHTPLFWQFRFWVLESSPIWAFKHTPLLWQFRFWVFESPAAVEVKQVAGWLFALAQFVFWVFESPRARLSQRVLIPRQFLFNVFDQPSASLNGWKQLLSIQILVTVFESPITLLSQTLLRHILFSLFRLPIATLTQFALSLQSLVLVFGLPSAVLTQLEFVLQSLFRSFEIPLSTFVQFEVASQLSAAYTLKLIEWLEVVAINIVLLKTIMAQKNKSPLLLTISHLRARI
jgi:hypothetical protein